MNREIKLRAWDKELKMMVYSKEQSGHMEYDTNTVDAINIMLNEDDYGFEFMEFTGLADKNGKEIYEGDILQKNIIFDGEIIVKNYIVVEYQSKKARFIGKWFKELELNRAKNEYDLRLDNTTLPLDCYIEEMIIIGNIYENSDLLEQN